MVSLFYWKDLGISLAYDLFAIVCCVPILRSIPDINRALVQLLLLKYSTLFKEYLYWNTQNASYFQNVEINSNPDLAAISHNAFEDVASLQRLSLRDNGLIVIDHTLVPWGQVGDIDLSGNHWHCDCHMAWVLVTADLMPERSAERIV